MCVPACMESWGGGGHGRQEEKESAFIGEWKGAGGENKKEQRGI